MITVQFFYFGWFGLILGDGPLGYHGSDLEQFKTRFRSIATPRLAGSSRTWWGDSQIQASFGMLMVMITTQFFCLHPNRFPRPLCTPGQENHGFGLRNGIRSSRSGRALRTLSIKCTYVSWHKRNPRLRELLRRLMLSNLDKTIC